MKLYPAQRYLLENKAKKTVVLKGRQMRISSAVLADSAYQLFTLPYTKIGLVAHNDPTAKFLLQTMHRFHRNLPAEHRPVADWNSADHMRFPNLDTYIYIESAESRAIGFGATLNKCHLSELSRWPPYKAQELFAGITQTVPLDGEIMVESTPRGRQGIFYQLYDAAKKGDVDYKPIFLPWWWDPDYRIAVDKVIEYSKEEATLRETFKLTPEQIMFRRMKIAELGDLFYQEYAENDIDCWLSSDIAVFDGVAIRRYLQQLQPGRQDGHWTIWKDVLGGEKYVIGVDAAGGTEKGDWSVAAVLRIKTNEYVARIRGKIPPDMFAQEVMRLGHHFNDALIAVEREMHGHTIIGKLLDSNYPNLHYYHDYDNLTGVAMAMPGWKTSGKSKPIMIDTLGAALRAGDIGAWSENFFLEASSYIWEGNKAVPGPHASDDELDAVMIALQLREQAPIQDNVKVAPMSYVSL